MNATTITENGHQTLGNKIARMPLRFILVVTAALPFNIPIHLSPIPTFHSELIAILCALLIFSIGGLHEEKEKIRRVHPSTLIWLGLSVYAAGSFLWIKYLFIDQWLVPTFFFAALGLAVLGISLSRLSARDTLTSIAWGLIGGALWQCAAVIAQLTETTANLSSFLFFHPPPHAPFGNLGQRNLFAHYLSWSVIACAWISSRNSKSSAVVFLCFISAIFFLFNILLSGSRSPAIYLLVWLSYCLYLARKNRAGNNKLITTITTYAVVGAAFQIFGGKIIDITMSMTNKNNTDAIIEQDFSRGNFAEARINELKKSVEIFSASPIIGIGWGNYAGRGAELHATRADITTDGSLFSHTHNILSQIAVEQGLIGLGLAIALFFYFFIRLRQTSDDIRPAIFCLTATTLAHSMFEYPLWDYHFLLVFGLLIAITEKANGPKINRIPPIIYLLVAVSGIVISYTYWENFNFLYRQQFPSPDEKTRKLQRDALINSPTVPGLEYAAQLTLLNHLPIGNKDGVDALALAQRLGAFRPTPQILGRLICEYSLAGQNRQREKTLGLFTRLYPDRVAAASAVLRQMECFELNERRQT